MYNANMNTSAFEIRFHRNLFIIRVTRFIFKIQIIEFSLYFFVIIIQLPPEKKEIG